MGPHPFSKKCAKPPKKGPFGGSGRFPAVGAKGPNFLKNPQFQKRRAFVNAIAVSETLMRYETPLFSVDPVLGGPPQALAVAIWSESPKMVDLLLKLGDLRLKIRVFFTF